MSCQMIRARDWDQMVQSGRVRGAVAPAPRPQPPAPAPVAPPPASPEGWPDLLHGQSDAELLLVIDRVRAAERQLRALVTELTAELARRTPSPPTGPIGGAPLPPG